MYDDAYWERLNLQKICLYMRTGDRLKAADEGSPSDRYERYSNAQYDAMRTFRNRVLSFNWNTPMTENEKDIQTEAMYSEVLTAMEGKSRLDYEMGFIAGIKIAMQMGIEYKQ